jgi:hypothetical protein
VKNAILFTAMFLALAMPVSAQAGHIIKVLKTENVRIEYQRMDLKQTDLNKYTDTVPISILCIDGYKFVYQGQALRQMFKEFKGESVPMKCDE